MTSLLGTPHGGVMIVVLIFVAVAVMVVLSLKPATSERCERHGVKQRDMASWNDLAVVGRQEPLRTRSWQFSCPLCEEEKKLAAH